MEKKLIPFNVVSYMVALSNGRVGTLSNEGVGRCYLTHVSVILRSSIAATKNLTS
ncbi:MAG: hypothetical protein K2Y22_08970 [Candidatus Obscuribacterales bacterium]|nr:hypothetical protein [Candidatus Obscuribacterales bacterium]